MFGPDGAGKTTQASLLTSYLIQSGFKVKRVWIRSLHTLAFVLSYIFGKLLHLKDPTAFRLKYKEHKWFRKIWLPIEFISVLPLVIIKVTLPYKLGYTIVAERFVIDWIVAMAYIFNDQEILRSRYAKLLFFFVPRSSKMIYIDSSYASIASRRSDCADSFEFIDFQRRCYKIYAQLLDAKVIDTSRIDVSETSKLIKQYLALT